MRKAGGDVGQGMESENGGASRKHVPLKLIELFLVRHQVCFRKWQCEEGFMSSLPRRNFFGQASEGLQKTLTKPNVQTRIEY